MNDLTRYTSDGDGGDPGDLYLAINDRYGYAAADQADAAARTGNIATLNATLSDIRRGTTNFDYGTGGNPSVNGQSNPALGGTSTLANFVENLGNTLRNPFAGIPLAWWIIGGAAIFFWLGGMTWARNRLNK